MTTRDNIVRLAELQENGELPPTAEDAIALAFADRHAHELRYVAAWGRWLHYDGTRWAQTTPCMPLIALARSAGKLRWIAINRLARSHPPRPSPPLSGSPRQTAGWQPSPRNGTQMTGC